jgi:hypothetical protein
MFDKSVASVRTLVEAARKIQKEAPKS